MTIPVNLKITSATASQNPSMVSLGRPRTCVSPIAKRTDHNTICSISLRAAASKKLCGTRCSRTLANVTGSLASGVAPAAGAARAAPTPGFMTLTVSRPRKSASVVMISK